MPAADRHWVCLCVPSKWKSGNLDPMGELTCLHWVMPSYFDWNGDFQFTQGRRQSEYFTSSCLDCLYIVVTPLGSHMITLWSYHCDHITREKSLQIWKENLRRIIIFYKNNVNETCFHGFNNEFKSSHENSLKCCLDAVKVQKWNSSLPHIANSQWKCFKKSFTFTN